MKNRIKEIRKELGLTQIEFGKRIQISGVSVSTAESGKTKPDNQTIELICREYNVNREWLENGTGQKYKEEDDSLLAKFGALMANGSDNKKELVRIILDMPDELLDAFMAYMEGRQKK